MRRFTIQFWKITCPTDTSLEQHLKSIKNRPQEERVWDRAGGPLIMRHLAKQDDLCRGDILRIQTDDFPVKAKSDGSTDALGLEKDEGLGTANAWIYHIPTKTLLFESNRSGVTAARAMEYVTYVTNTPGKITLDPILAESALEKYKTMAEPTKLEITFANIDAGALLHDLDNELMQTAETMFKNYHAPYVTLSMSVGRQSGTLGSRLTQQVLDLLRGKTKDSGTIKKCRAHGREVLEGETTVLDLLTNKIVDEGVVSSDDRNQASFEIRVAALKEAWRRRGKEVIRLTPKK